MTDGNSGSTPLRATTLITNPNIIYMETNLPIITFDFERIGKHCIVLDDSYGYNIKTKATSTLAKDKTPVKIISGVFKCGADNGIDHRFVTVKHKTDVYVVLNKLKLLPERKHLIESELINLGLYHKVIQYLPNCVNEFEDVGCILHELTRMVTNEGYMYWSGHLLNYHKDVCKCT